MKVIFLHGLGQTSTSWNKTISFLSQEITAYTPTLFDLLGPQTVTYQNLFHSFESYASSFSQPISLCGLSLGAVLALDYATTHPEKVKSLILIAPQYKMPKNLLRFQNALFSLMSQKAFLSSGLPKQDMIALTKSMIPLNFESKLRRISCPVFIVYGKKDWANQKSAVQLASLISHSQIQEMDQAGHEVNVTHAKELGKILNTFFQQEIKRTF